MHHKYDFKKRLTACIRNQSLDHSSIQNNFQYMLNKNSKRLDRRNFYANSHKKQLNKIVKELREIREEVKINIVTFNSIDIKLICTQPIII